MASASVRTNPTRRSPRAPGGTRCRGCRASGTDRPDSARRSGSCHEKAPRPAPSTGWRRKSRSGALPRAEAAPRRGTPSAGVGSSSWREPGAGRARRAPQRGRRHHGERHRAGSEDRGPPAQAPAREKIRRPMPSPATARRCASPTGPDPPRRGGQRSAAHRARARVGETDGPARRPPPIPQSSPSALGSIAPPESRPSVLQKAFVLRGREAQRWAIAATAADAATPGSRREQRPLRAAATGAAKDEEEPGARRERRQAEHAVADRGSVEQPLPVDRPQRQAAQQRPEGRAATTASAVDERPDARRARAATESTREGSGALSKS